MKKLLVVLAVALSLGGCATAIEQVFGLPTGVLTQSIEQPVTRTMYRNASNTLILATVGLNIYKGKCERAEIAASCVAVVEQLQSYTRRAKPALVSLRGFVRKNDQVNAKLAYRTVMQIISDLKTATVVNGAR